MVQGSVLLLCYGGNLTFMNSSGTNFLCFTAALT